MQGRVASRMPRIVVVSENSIRDIHTDMGVAYDRMRLVPVGVDPELFRPRPDVARVPGRLITTASADVALKGLAYLLEAMAKLRTERDVTLTIIGKPKAGKSMDLIDSLGLRAARPVRLRRHRRAHRRALRRGRAGRRAEPLRGLQPAGHRGDGHRHRARRHRRRRPARGHRHATATPCCRAAAGDADALAATIARGLDDPELRARVGAAGRQRVLERWTWRRCAELTVEQYREVLAMPANVEKLRRNGRIALTC